MGQSITVTRAFGWVIDRFGGDFVGDLEQFIPEADQADVADWVEARLKDSQLEVVIDPFGYHFNSLALVAKASAVDAYDWYHELDTFVPDKAKEPQLRRELLQALDVLEWEEAGLGDPTWLLLVAWG